MSQVTMKYPIQLTLLLASLTLCGPTMLLRGSARAQEGKKKKIEGPEPPLQVKDLIQLTNKWRKDVWDVKDIEARRNAVDGFRQLSAEMSSVVDSMRSRLHDRDDEIRMKAAQGLSSIGPSAGRAVWSLAETLEKDKNPEVRRSAAAAIGNILRDGCNPLNAKEGIPPLIKAMRTDPDRHVRWIACRAFRSIGPMAKDAAPHLLEVIKGVADPQLCEYAWLSLSSIVGPDSKAIVPTLLQMYENEQDWIAKTFLLTALGRIGDKHEVVIPMVIVVLNDPKQKQLRAGAVQAIQFLGPKASQAVPLLIDLLDAKDFASPNAELAMRLSVLRALETIGPGAKAAVPAVQRLMKDPLFRGDAERTLNAISGT